MPAVHSSIIHKASVETVESITTKPFPSAEPSIQPRIGSIPDTVATLPLWCRISIYWGVGAGMAIGGVIRAVQRLAWLVERLSEKREQHILDSCEPVRKRFWLKMCLGAIVFGGVLRKLFQGGGTHLVGIELNPGPKTHPGNGNRVCKFFAKTGSCKHDPCAFKHVKPIPTGSRSKDDVIMDSVKKEEEKQQGNTDALNEIRQEGEALIATLREQAAAPLPPSPAAMSELASREAKAELDKLLAQQALATHLLQDTKMEQTLGFLDHIPLIGERISRNATRGRWYSPGGETPEEAAARKQKNDPSPRTQSGLEEEQEPTELLLNSESSSSSSSDEYDIPPPPPTDPIGPGGDPSDDPLPPPPPFTPGPPTPPADPPTPQPDIIVPATHEYLREKFFNGGFRMTSQFARIKITTYPQQEWERVIGSKLEEGYFDSKGVRKGLIPKIMNFFGEWNPYETVEEVAIYAYPYALEHTKCVRPFRDNTPGPRDDVVIHYQPLFVIRMVDQGECYFSVEKGRGERRMFRPDATVQELEEQQIMKRLPLETLAQHRQVCYKPLTVSLYLFSELYSRKISLTSPVHQVERLFRFAAEDDQTSAQLDVYLKHGRHTLRDTMSFMIGVHQLDMRTPLTDF